jgi:hypothetical protein
MATKREGKVTRLLTFNGKREDYNDWHQAFRSFATVHQFGEALSVMANMPAMEATALSTDVDTKKLQKACIKKNNGAMSQLNLALTTDADKGLIYKACGAWKDGLASRVMELMEKRYNSRDTSALLALKKELNNTTMAESEEPAAVFGRLARIKNRYDAPGDEISNKDIMSVVLAIALEKYHGDLTNLQMDKGNNLTSDDIEDTMTTFYQLSIGSNAVKAAGKKKNKNSDAANGEYQLAAVNKNKNACWDCGKTGHRKGDSECQSKGKGLNMPAQGGTPGKGKACSTCGKIHKGSCWEVLKPEFAHR